VTAGDAQKKNRLRKVTFFAGCYDPLKERILTHERSRLAFSYCPEFPPTIASGSRESDL
jgi:hypothetical protein